LHININELKKYIMEIVMKGNETEITQLINNISNNASNLKELSKKTLVIDELEYTINSICVDVKLYENNVEVKLNTKN